MSKFFIRDCNGRIVGNPRGYATMRSALVQAERWGSPAWQALWAAFEAREDYYEKTCMPVPLRKRNYSTVE